MSIITITPTNGRTAAGFASFDLDTEQFSDFGDFTEQLIWVLDGHHGEASERDANSPWEARDLLVGEVTFEVDGLSNAYALSMITLEEAYTAGVTNDGRDDDGAVWAYITATSQWDAERFEESYQGRFSSDQDFAQNMAEELSLIDQDAAWPYSCIDWEQAARDLMYDYTEQDGHYFRDL